MRLLLVEDNPDMADVVARGLADDGHTAELVATGEDAIALACSSAYDVILLDVSLPGIDGFETCSRLRAEGVLIPILMLTARDASEEIVNGLEVGADDYVTKPFDMVELVARIRALARRAEGRTSEMLVAGDLRLEPGTRRVWRGDSEVVLSQREFTLLEALMRRTGEALSRNHLIEHAFDHAMDGQSNVIDVYIGYLRQKVDRPFGRASIETVRGLGYRLNPEA